MNLKIIGTFDRGKGYLERVLLEATSALNLSFFLVLHTTKVGDGVGSGSRPAFWFPSTQVPAGQRVQLFTGGRISTEPLPGYNFFWGLPKTVLNTPDDCLVVVQAADWQSAIEPPAITSPLLGNLTLGGGVSAATIGEVGNLGTLGELGRLSEIGGLGGGKKKS